MGTKLEQLLNELPRLGAESSTYARQRQLLAELGGYRQEEEEQPINEFIEDVFPLIVIGSIVALLIAAAIYFKRKRRKSSAAYNRPERSQNNELGSADMATAEHIKKWTKRHSPLDTLLPVTELRTGTGIALKKGYLTIPIEERNRHLLIVAKTGSGKTTRLIDPVIYNDCLCKTRSTVVLDSKPEMWARFAAMTRALNPEKKIVLFNPLDTARSLSWNILEKIQTDTDAKLIANTIIMATDQPNSKSDSPFFRNNALSILNAVMVGLMQDPNETLSMPRVHELTNSGMKFLCDWLEAHPAAIRNTRTFVELARSGSQNADTIMSELGMRLSAWDLNAIRATTFHNELDLECLIQEPTLFIIELRESEIEMLRPLANVLVVEILRFLTKRAESFKSHKLPRPVGFVIDEFASALGRLPDIHVKLNTLRSRNVSIVAAIQSIAQIKAAYEDKADSVLAGFSTKLFMPSLDQQDSEWASKESGQMTIRYKTMSSGSSKRLIDFWSNSNKGSQEQIQQRAVLTPAEIGTPADNACTFFMPNTPVFQGHLVPWFRVPEILKRIQQFEKEGDELQLRAEPIVVPELTYLPPPEPVAALPAPADSSNSTAVGAPLSNTELVTKIDANKELLGWNETTGIARQWWTDFEKENENNPQLIYTVTEELRTRGATISEFFLAYVYSNSDQITDTLAYLDKRREELRTDGKQDSSGLSDAELTQTIDTIKKALDWDSTTGLAREWWETFETENKDNPLLILTVCSELEKRRATIEEFFLAYVHSNSENIQENLDFLDKNRTTVQAGLEVNS